MVSRTASFSLRNAMHLFQELALIEKRWLATIALQSCTLYHRVNGGVIIAAKNRDRKSMSLWKTGTPHLTLEPNMRVPTDHRLHLAHLQHLLSQSQVSKIGIAQAPVRVMRLAAHLFLEERHMRHYQHTAHAGISLKS